MSTKDEDKRNDVSERDDDVPPLLVEEKSANLSTLAKAKFASVKYDEVEASGPAAAPLGFPAPHGEFPEVLYLAHF